VLQVGATNVFPAAVVAAAAGGGGGAAAAAAAVQLVELFGSVRDNWIAEDLSGWLAPNRIYPGVADAVAAAMQQSEVYIVTTKQVCSVLVCMHS
jgi:hypothetical protein